MRGWVHRGSFSEMIRLLRSSRLCRQTIEGPTEEQVLDQIEMSDDGDVYRPQRRHQSLCDSLSDYARRHRIRWVGARFGC